MGESEPGKKERKDQGKFEDIQAAIRKLLEPYERMQQEFSRLERILNPPALARLMQTQEALTAIQERWQRIAQVMESNLKVLEAIQLSTAPVLQNVQTLDAIYGRLEPLYEMGSEISSSDLLAIQSAVDDAKRDQEGSIAELKKELKEKEKENEELRKQLKKMGDDIERASKYTI